MGVKTIIYGGEKGAYLPQHSTYICIVGKVRSQSASGPEYLFPFIIMYLIKHPCTSIVVAFSRPNMYGLITEPPMGLGKRGRKKSPLVKVLFLHRERSVFVQVFLRRTHTIFYPDDHDRGGVRREDNEWFENQTHVGLFNALHFCVGLTHVDHD